MPTPSSRVVRRAPTSCRCRGRHRLHPPRLRPARRQGLDGRRADGARLRGLRRALPHLPLKPVAPLHWAHAKLPVGGGAGYPARAAGERRGLGGGGRYARRHDPVRLPAGRQGLPRVPAQDTREEYALARTERKSGRGYRGFTFHCPTSRWRRTSPGDLTINAIAQAEDGSLIDPFGGQLDLRRKVLRHSRGLPRGPGAHPARCTLRRPLPCLHPRCGDWS